MGSVFPLIVEHAPVGMLLVDARGKIVHANPKAEGILGYAKDELLGQTMEILLPERVRILHVGHRAGFIADPKPRSMGGGRHLYALHKSGREIPVEIGLVPIETPKGMAVLASIVDISAAKEAAKSTAQLAAVVEASEEAIITLGPNGEVLTWNRGAKKLYGYSAEEMLGKNISPVVPSDRMEEFREMRERMGRGESVQQMETVRLRKDGRPLHVLLSISPLFNEDGTFRGGATITHDITERKRLEQDILSAVEMEQKRIGQDLHDSLGQQLLAVSFLCNVLKKKLAAQSREESLEAAHIEDLLNEAKLNLRKLTRGLYAADLESLGIGTCLKDLTQQVQEISSIHCSYDGDATTTIDNRSVTENLYRLAQEALNNAVKHSQAKDIMVSLHKKGQQVTLTIKDNGIGLPPSASRHSSGMGLRTMRYRAHVIGGFFEVGVQTEGGTMVRCSVLLPS
jgi:two-component system sensor kinase FixL